MAITRPSVYGDGTYLKANPDWHVGDSPWKAQQVLHMLRRHQMNPGTVCEVGCGAGEILHRLQLQLPADVELHGYEISPDAFRLCSTRANERLHFHFGDLTVLQVERFDLLLMIDVIEHVENCFGFLRALRAKAKYLIAHIPLDLTVHSLLRNIPMLNRQALGHIHYFTRDTALALLTETGWTVLDHFYTRNPSGERSVTSGIRKWCLHFAPDLSARMIAGFSLLVLARSGDGAGDGHTGAQ